jgi:hypothetical protein
MSNKLLVKITAVLTLLIAIVWGFWTIDLPADEIIGAQYKQSIRLLAPPSLVKVSDADGSPIFWYNNDYGAMPTKIERGNADE